MDKLFAVAGTSVLEGKCKARFAKDMARAKVLSKNGHTDIKLVELPKPMDKASALAHISKLPQFADAVSQAAIKADSGDAPAKPAKQPKPTKMAEAVVHAAAKTVKAKKVEPAPAPKVELTAEQAAAKAKNLETIRKVHAKVKAMEKRSGLADEKHPEEVTG